MLLFVRLRRCLLRWWLWWFVYCEYVVVIVVNIDVIVYSVVCLRVFVVVVAVEVCLQWPCCACC